MLSKSQLGRLFAIFAIFVSAIACQNPQDSKQLKQSDSQKKPSFDQTIIYGDDNRLDLYEVTNPNVQLLARSSVALISAKNLSNLGNGQTQLLGQSLGRAMNLCSTEKFYNQISAAKCSGALVGPDLVLTAGHCMAALNSCSTTKFVFDYANANMGDNITRVETSNVYSCREIVRSVLTMANADYSVVKLDRPVLDRSPLAVRRDGGVVGVGEGVLVIGYPLGIPLKVTSGGVVRNNSAPTHFVTNLDTFGGNSGSPVFNENTGLIEGVLVRGDEDFVKNGFCQVSKKCSTTGCRGEEATKISEAIAYIPDTSPNPTPTPINTPTPTPTSTPQREGVYDVRANAVIPDNDSIGITSELSVPVSTHGKKVIIYVSIKHTWIGDVIVKAKAPDGSEVVLQNRQGGNAANLEKSFEIPMFSDRPAGVWKLYVADLASFDTGILVEWGINIQ